MKRSATCRRVTDSREDRIKGIMGWVDGSVQSLSQPAQHITVWLMLSVPFAAGFL